MISYSDQVSKFAKSCHDDCPTLSNHKCASIVSNEDGKIADVHLFDFDLYNRTTKWAPILRHDEAQR
jgi:hypothetical protein